MSDAPTPHPSTRSLARWDDDARTDPALVWWAQLDRRYLVEVVRRAGGAGAALRIWDHDAGDRLVAEHRVQLADDAEFGPAIEDVVQWQRLAVRTVDDQPAHDAQKGNPR